MLMRMIACKAYTHNTVVYYSGIVIPGGAYVIDTSEPLGELGDEAYDCLLNVFRTTLANNLNCTRA
jgi:hypothetical protein